MQRFIPWILILIRVNADPHHCFIWWIFYVPFGRRTKNAFLFIKDEKEYAELGDRNKSTSGHNRFKEEEEEVDDVDDAIGMEMDEEEDNKERDQLYQVWKYFISGIRLSDKWDPRESGK